MIGRHVPSHAGFAGNELADVLAKFASKHPVPDEAVSRPYWPSQVSKHDFAEWAWLAIRHRDDLPVLGAFESEACRLFVEAATRPYSFYAPVQGAGDCPEAITAEIGIQLRLCTLNVLSMREHDGLPQGVAVFGKRHLGSASSTAVGTAGAECENQAGAAFHACLVSSGLCVPSTFPEYHQGQHLTWKIGSSLGHRLDYVAVPEEWSAGALVSSVWHDFDHVHDADDHQPVRLHCELVRKAASAQPKAFFKAPRPQAGTDPGQLQCFQYALEAMPRVGWQVDVDMHYAAFVRSTLWCWTEFVKDTPRRRCKPFVSEGTLEAIEHRRQVRRFLVAEETELGRVRLLIGLFAFWLQWQQVEANPLQIQCLASMLRRGRHHTASAIGCLGRLRHTLRRAIRYDRASYWQGLATDVAESSLQQPKQLFAAVYKAFPVVKTKRRGGFCPLPAVLLDDGSRARDLNERVQRWTEHFVRQEGGRIVSAVEYDQEVQPQAPSPHRVPDFDICCVPTLLDIEQDMLQLRKGKAPGPDMITADLLKLNVPFSSRRLLPIFTKTALACREPIVFKGGCLITLAKKAYASLNCADFRSIILSSVPGKLLHRSLRRRLLPPLSDIALPLQAGALPGASPELLTLYLTAFQRWARSTRHNWAVIFFDVKQAYYRTLRQLVVDCDSDESICRVLYDLGLPSQATCELRALLQRAAATSPLAGKQHLNAMLRDLLTATWFKFEASLMVSVTHKGTRPGDPAADALFAFTLSALFRAIDSSLESQGLVDMLPPVRQDPLLDGFESAPRLQFVSWADDFARPVVGSSPTVLVDKVQRATQCCTERASSCGIELTFGCDKTAVVCDVGAVQTMRDQNIDILDSGIAFIDSVACRSCVLPVVHAYKHLGGIFSATSKSDLEVFLRRAAALGPIRPVRAKLFACSAVPLTTRRTLLFSLGLSRFIHGAGALHLNQKGHQRIWHAAYISIWAHLVPNLPRGKPHSFQVLYVSKAPPPHFFLALQRAALLAKLVSKRFVSILHMLQLEWEATPDDSWLSQLVHDISAVARWVPTAQKLQHCRWPLHELCRQIDACASWWSSVIKQAVKDYAADTVKWKSMPKIVPVPDGGVFQCHVCQASFGQRSFLAVHLARKHQLFAPARHFAQNRQCVACLRTFATVMLAQAHLRRNPACLRRAVWLMEPLELSSVLEAAAADKMANRKVQKGGWQQQRTVMRAQQGFGHHVTAVDIEEDPEPFPITVVAKQFRPSASVSRWVEEYLAGSTRAGPRQKSVCWWHAKPSELNSF